MIQRLLALSISPPSPRTRVSRYPHSSGSPAWCSRAAYTAVAGRLPIPRQGEILRLVRGRRGRGESRIHGGFPSTVGRRSAQWHDQRAGMEDQAELVFGRYRGQDDSTASPALYVQACGFDSRRSRGSHAIYMSQPDAVATFIKDAAKAVINGPHSILFLIFQVVLFSRIRTRAPGPSHRGLFHLRTFGLF